MDDIIFQVGDEIRVLEAYREIAPDSVLIGVKLRVSPPGLLRELGEVPIRYQGELYYVPAQYVQAA